MLISVLDTAGKQIAWIDHVKLATGTLFRDGDLVFRLREDGILQEATVQVLDTDAKIEVAANDD
jgi:hypothetical protein